MDLFPATSGDVADARRPRYGHFKRCRYGEIGETGKKPMEGGVDEGFEAEPAIRVSGDTKCTKLFVSCPRHSS